MPFLADLKQCIIPLTDKEQKQLKTLFDAPIELLNNSILPDYSPQLKKEILTFVQCIQSDCQDGYFSLSEAREISRNLWFWISAIINLDINAANYHHQIIRQELLQGRNQCTMFDTWNALFKLGVIATIGYISGFLTSTITANDKHFWPTTGSVWIVGTIATLVVTTLDKLRFTNTYHLYENTQRFFSETMQPSTNTFAKNYYQLADKIFHAISDHKSQDELIDIIRQNMQNMKEEKIIQNDISQGTFTRRLLDIRVNNHTLRTYLKRKDMLEAIQEIITAQIAEIQRVRELEEDEGIQEEASSMRILNLV